MEIWTIFSYTGEVLACGLPSQIDLSQFGQAGVDFWIFSDFGDLI